MPLITPDIRLTTQPMPRRPPVPQLILIVPIEGTPVKHKRLPGLHVGRCILIPNIPVHKTWPYGPALALERAQQPRNALIQDQLGAKLVLGPRGMLALVHLEDVRQLLAVEDFPGGFPAVCQLCRLAVAGRGVESEFASWGNRLFVELGEPGGEACRLWRLLPYLTEFGEEEVVCWSWGFVLSPGIGFGAEGGRDGVDGFVGFVLALAHYSVAFAGCHLGEFRDTRRTG